MSVAKVIPYDSVNKIWSGPERRPIYHPNSSLADMILYNLKKAPNQVVQINDTTGYKMTSGEMRQNIIRVGVNLESFGIGSGDIVSLLMRQNDNMVPIFMGIIAAGAIPNPLDISFGNNELKYMFKLMEPKLIICDLSYVEMIKDILSELELKTTIIVAEKGDSGIVSIDSLLQKSDRENTFIPPAIEDGTKTTAIIMCSSGTTSLPKGVLLTHAQAIYGLSSWWDITQDSVLYTPSDFNWITCICIVIQSLEHNCTRIFSQAPVTAELVLHILEKYKVNHIFLSPAFAHKMIPLMEERTYDLSHLQGMCCGGSVMSELLRNELNKHMHIKSYAIYGMTEMCLAITDGVSSRDNTSLGLLSPRVQAKILDDDGNFLKRGECGEVLLKGCYPFTGYYKDPVASKNSQDADGFIYTGDIGYFDDKNLLYLVGRKKDMFKYCNFQITPSEMEEVIAEHPAVDAVCIVGIPDEKVGDLPAAVIVLKTNAKCTVSEIKGLIEKNMSDAKQLRGGVYFVESLPMTSTKKIKRGIVRDLAIQLRNEDLEININS